MSRLSLGLYCLHYDQVLAYRQIATNSLHCCNFTDSNDTLSEEESPTTQKMTQSQRSTPTIPKRKRDFAELQCILLEKEIIRVEVETAKLKAEHEKIELQKEKLKLELKLLETKYNVSNEDTRMTYTIL